MNRPPPEDLVERRIRAALTDQPRGPVGAANEAKDLLTLETAGDPTAFAGTATAMGGSVFTRLARRALYRLLFPVLEQQRRYTEANTRIALQLSSRVSLLERADASRRSSCLASECAGDLLALRDALRTDEESVRRHLSRYVDLFTGKSPVLDIGCGRGEFLALLGEVGTAAVGVDPDRHAVQHCRDRSLAAEHADGLEFLAGLQDGTLGGLFGAGLIERMAPSDLSLLVTLAAAKLRPGGVILLESANPRSRSAMEELHLDLTHIRPYDPRTVSWLLEYRGFVDVVTEFSPTVDERESLAAHGKSVEARDASSTVPAADVAPSVDTPTAYAIRGVSGTR